MKLLPLLLLVACLCSIVHCLANNTIAKPRKLKFLLGSDAYCNAPQCPTGNIACHNPPKFSVECLQETRLISLDKYRKLIEQTFNKLRNKVASGKGFRNLPAAARMARMVWSPELEQFAILDVVRCRLKPKKCMASPDFYYIGTISRSSRFDVVYANPSIADLVQDYLKQSVAGVVSIAKPHTLHMPKYYEDADIPPSALLITERNTHYGCGALQTGYQKSMTFYISCAFATDNVIGVPMYKWGPRPGIKCDKLDTEYEHLCAPGEKYNNNQAFPLKYVYSQE